MSWRTWIGVLAIAVPLVAGMSALSVAVVRADRAEQAAETVRLALWQLDAQAGALLVAEASRAADAYDAFSVGADGHGVIASPLLESPAPPIALHLQISADGRITSPQIPPARWRARACAGRTTAQAIAAAEVRLQSISTALARLPGGVAQWQAQIPTLSPSDDGRVSAHEATEAPSAFAAPAAALAPSALMKLEPSKKEVPAPQRQDLEAPTTHAASTNEDAKKPVSLNLAKDAAADSVAPAAPVVRQEIIGNQSDLAGSGGEFRRRSANALQSQQYATTSSTRAKERKIADENVSVTTYGFPEAAREQPAAAKATGGAVVASAEINPSADVAAAESGPMQAQWLDERLLLVRRARLGGHQVIQAAVVEWPVLRGQLLAMLADRLPTATLVPAVEGDALATRLASLPVRLIPGDLAAAPLGNAAWWTLGVAWLGTCVGIVGAAVLLILAHRLSERRAVFVSAVTHELRTPLTSLRLNADLLADARIGGDETKRVGRIAALRSEAGRLAHLIDNVLDYARLERRQPPAPRAVVLSELLTPLLPRLQERLTVSGLTLTCDVLPAVAMTCDPAAVERILANVVDNAAKYAADSVEHNVVVRALVADRRVEIRLRDYGPGLSADVQARLFVPFARSAEAAAGHAPGVGLGLALCRRLARAQGGDLRLDQPDDGPGVEAVLTLPLA